MRLKLFGPLDCVTGSSYLLEDELLDCRVLIDCGMRQGTRDAAALNAAEFPFDPKTISLVVLTHAHIDHCGLLPRLYREGFKGTVYATKETAALATIVLEDAAKREDAPYCEADVARIRWHEQARACFGEYQPVAKDLYIRFFRTAHLPGAVSVQVVWGPRDTQRRITFSGDLGCNVEDQEHQPLMRHRMNVEPADYCVVESTYGGTIRPDEDGSLEARIARLDAALSPALQTGGVVIIPCFALGRTQDVLFDLTLLFARDEKYDSLPVYLDAPMAAKANVVFAKAMERMILQRNGKTRPAWLNKGLFRLFELDPTNPEHEQLIRDALREMLVDNHEPTSRRTGKLKNWRRIWAKLGPRAREARESIRGPAVIVTGGGMCDGGPVQDHLARHLCDRSTTVLLTGYSSPSTVGGKLFALKDVPVEQRARLTGSLGLESDDVALAEVRASIIAMRGYSAHADQPGLLEWLFFKAPGSSQMIPAARRVFVTHGDVTPRRALAAAIERRAAELDVEVRVELPGTKHGWFDLDRERWEEGEMSEVDRLRVRVAEMERQLRVQSLAGASGP